jgi:hypothetical protein
MLALVIRPEDIPKFLESHRVTGYDCVFGSRFMKGEA